jgi:hypothetical protein
MPFDEEKWHRRCIDELLPEIIKIYNYNILEIALPEMRATAPHAELPRKGLHNAEDFRDTLYIKYNASKLAYIHSDDPRAKWLIKTEEEWDLDNRLLWIGETRAHPITAKDAPMLRWRWPDWSKGTAHSVQHPGYKAPDWYDRALEKAQIAFMSEVGKLQPLYEQICKECESA